MDTIDLPHDFREFLQLLNSEKVRYLLVGGYAVGIHGYPRPTGDMDIWVAISRVNAARIMRVLQKFGFGKTLASIDLFLKKDQIVRMGIAPVRIELLTSISGVQFSECFRKRKATMMDGVKVNVINLGHLKINKRASGRLKDLNDLEHLP